MTLGSQLEACCLCQLTESGPSRRDMARRPRRMPPCQWGHCEQERSAAASETGERQRARQRARQIYIYIYRETEAGTEGASATKNKEERVRYVNPRTRELVFMRAGALHNEHQMMAVRCLDRSVHLHNAITQNHCAWRSLTVNRQGWRRYLSDLCLSKHSLVEDWVHDTLREGAESPSLVLRRTNAARNRWHQLPGSSGLLK